VNRFDQAARYLAKLDPTGFLAWVLGVEVLFHRWLDTRSLPFPAEPDRTSDTVACVTLPDQPRRHWAVPVEFCSRPPVIF